MVSSSILIQMLYPASSSTMTGNLRIFEEMGLAFTEVL